MNNIINNWKSLPYWAKGATFGLAIALIVEFKASLIIAVGALIGWIYGEFSKKQSEPAKPENPQ